MFLRQVGTAGGRVANDVNTGVRSCTSCGASMATALFRPHAVSNGTGDFWRYVCPECRRWLDVPVHVPEWPGWQRRDARRVDGVVVPESLSSYRQRMRAVSELAGAGQAAEEEQV